MPDNVRKVYRSVVGVGAGRDEKDEVKDWMVVLCTAPGCYDDIGT